MASLAQCVTVAALLAAGGCQLSPSAPLPGPPGFVGRRVLVTGTCSGSFNGYSTFNSKEVERAIELLGGAVVTGATGQGGVPSADVVLRVTPPCRITAPNGTFVDAPEASKPCLLHSSTGLADSFCPEVDGRVLRPDEALARMMMAKPAFAAALAGSGGGASPPPPVAQEPPLRSGVAAAHASSTPQRLSYALVVGIEHYRDLPAPIGAKADAQAFSAMLASTLGLPETNVRIALDDRATGKDLERHLAWLKTNVPAGGRVYFFFSGHGAPGVANGASYIVPYDGDAQAIEETSCSLDKVLSALGETKAKEVLAFVDACFSGAGGRSVLPKGARPLMKLKDVSRPKAVALFSAASAQQISGPSEEGSNGAFTKYLVQAIGDAKADANGDGQLTLEELSQWVTPRVEREAKKQNRVQTPTLVMGTNLGGAKDLAVAGGLK